MRTPRVASSVGLALIAVAVAAPGSARAEPFDDGTGAIWDHVARADGDIFRRADGTVVDVSPAKERCDKVSRARPTARHDWLPPTFWPTIDLPGDRVVLCLELGPIAALVTITPGPGTAVGADTAPLLRTLVRSTRKPIDLPTVGPIYPSRLPLLYRDDNVQFVIDEQSVGFGLSRAEHGSCADEHAVVVAKLASATADGFAPGWWPTRMTNDDVAYGCLDLREGYVTAFVKPAAKLGLLVDILGEVRRAAYERHGAPVSSEDEAMVLPHSQQRLAARGGPGLWKVVDGEAVKRPGADLLVSMAGLAESTRYRIAVEEGPCAPGTAELPAYQASPLFPAALGTVWTDTRDPRIRWTAWACVTGGGQTATVTILSALADIQPPPAAEQAALYRIVAVIARSYGVDASLTPVVSVPVSGGGGGGGGYRRHGKVAAMIGVYAGALSLGPDEGDRRRGGLVGFDMRVIQRKAMGAVFAFDTELGYGGGEFLGEIRAGLGLNLGGLEAVAGISVGSIGPGAALDGYAQVGTTLELARGKLFLGGLYAVGMAGADQLRADARIVLSGRKDTGLFLGGRAIWFGDTTADDGQAQANGDAFLIVVGSGLASED